jgi:hypothetical protein
MTTRQQLGMAALLLAFFGGGCGAEEPCRPEHQSPVTARELGELSDKANASIRYDGTLDQCNDHAYLHFTGHDDSIVDANKAGVAVAYDSKHGDELELCIYAACIEGATQVKSCDAGNVDYFPILSDWGQPGCCRKGAGSIDLTYHCDSGLSDFINRAGADFYVHVCPTKVTSSTIAYSGEVHF